MNDQLALLSPAARSDDGSAPTAPGPAWQLDDHTRHVGRLGLAAARDALRQASGRLAA